MRHSGQTSHSRIGGLVAAALLASACATTAPSEPAALSNTEMLANEALIAPAHREGFSMLAYADDPLEPANRVSLRFTKGALDFVVHPLATGYRALVPEPARAAVGRLYYNLNYPDRFLSLFFQGRVKDSAEETGRFLVNSTLGLAGLFDPAERFRIDTFHEDLGQAFGRWGIRDGPYLFLPLLGPSNARDFVGRVFDTALDPATYFTGATFAFAFNAFSLRADDYRDLSQSEADWYVPIRTYWAIRRAAEVENYTIPASAYAASDPEPSLGVMKLTLKDPRFPRRARERKVELAATGAKLRYSVWLQREPAPLLFLLPGIGAHRRGSTSVAVAELAFVRGFSVAAVSSTFQPEVQLTALRSPYPGYSPHDAADLRVALEAIYADLRAWRPGRITSASLLGLSLGGVNALHIASQTSQGNPAGAAGAVRFERIVAVNPPVDFLRASERFDEFFDAPLRWPAEERDRRVLELGKKAFALLGSEQADPRLPFDRIESEFLIGLNARDAVHNAMVAIRKATGRGLLLEPTVDPQRGPLLEAVNHASFGGYVQHFVLPHFLESGPGTATVEELLAAAGLHQIGAALTGDPRVAVFTNADDFLLSPADVAWLEQTLGPRVTVFASGGHLGNLWVPDVQAAIFGALAARPDDFRGE